MISGVVSPPRLEGNRLANRRTITLVELSDSVIYDQQVQLSDSCDSRRGR